MLQVPSWTLRAEVLGTSDLPALLSPWEDLCARAVEDNVYYSPRYARALLDTVEKHRKVQFALVWEGPQLLALLPFTTTKLAVPGAMPGAGAWQSKYTFNCMPLLDKGRAGEAAAALVDTLARTHPGEWIVPAMNTHGAAGAALTSALAQGGMPWAFVNPFQRALLEATESFDEHMKRHVPAKRRRELARTRRRLEELGNVVHESYRFGEGLERAVLAFLEIEGRGWKGERGTALGSRADTREFALRAFTGEENTSICRADVLKLNDSAIAVSVMVFAGSTGFTVKTTYDEAYRSYSAGLLLEVDVISSLLSERWASRLDAATAGTHVVDTLWPGRMEVADLVFSLAPRNRKLRFSALRHSELIRKKLRESAKRVHAWLTRS